MGIFGKPETKPAQSPARPLAAPPAVQAAAGPPGACIIGPKTVIKGDVTGEEDVQVQGTIEGTVRIGRDLRIAPGGTVKATVEARSVTIGGELLGDCHATQRVEIQTGGRLIGNIRAPRVVIVEGATFRGNSDMSAERDRVPAKGA
jgi:cytoskeletal protein CcmA (bactofilin family)